VADGDQLEVRPGFERVERKDEPESGPNLSRLWMMKKFGGRA
jgi:hypothetical protein